MNKICFLVLLCCSCIQSIYAQFDKWTIHQAYNNTALVAETPNYVFAVADSSLYAYGKEDQSLTTYSKKNGLSDNKIKVIRYHANKQYKIKRLTISTSPITMPIYLHKLVLSLSI